MRSMVWVLGLLWGCDRGPPTWEVPVACTLHAPGTAQVELRVDVPGCLDAPLGTLALYPSEAGSHVLVAHEDPALETLRTCTQNADHVMLWVLPDGGSGCGHRLPLDGPLPAGGLTVTLSQPLTIASTSDAVEVRGTLQVSAQ
jgi:hypothetical protein